MKGILPPKSCAQKTTQALRWHHWTLRFVVAIGTTDQCCHDLEGQPGRANCPGLDFPDSLVGGRWVSGLISLELSLPNSRWQLSEPLGPSQGAHPTGLYRSQTVLCSKVGGV